MCVYVNMWGKNNNNTNNNPCRARKSKIRPLIKLKKDTHNNNKRLKKKLQYK